MAEYNNGGLDSKSLAERKSKRLEEALSAYTHEQTKETVSKLLEAYVDDGKNYFGAGTRDTTLYFADDEYIREIEKEKAASSQSEDETDLSDEPKTEKSSIASKLQKLTSIIPGIDSQEEKEEDVHSVSEADRSNVIPISRLDERFAEKAAEQAEPETEKAMPKTYQEAAAEIDEQAATAVEELMENLPEEPEAEKINEEKESADTENSADDSSVAPEAEKEKAPVKSAKPEPEPTIVIEPVKAEDIEKQDETEEETEEMRREFFDNEVEIDEVPRRRRKKAEPQEVQEEKAPVIEEEDEDDYEDDDYEDDYEDDFEDKKGKFGGFFSRKKRNDDFFDDDDDYDDDDFDDDDYYDDDDYDDEGIFTFKRVLNIIIIVALICSTAFFAASNYTNTKKLETANTQINELNNGNAAGSADEQINDLKAQIDTLTAENERLKAGTTPDNTGNTGTVTPAPSGASSTTISGTAPADDNGSSTSSASGKTYTIKAGDTGSKICNAVYGQYTPELWDGILAANGMTTSTVYHPGDVLQIP